MTEKSKEKSDKIPEKAVSNQQYQNLVVNGETYVTLYTKKYQQRKKWAQHNEKHIMSPIPGTILKVLVKEGDKVGKDKPLLVYEAMKMENTMFSVHEGVIKKVYVKPGDKVPNGFLLMEYK